MNKLLAAALGFAAIGFATNPAWAIPIDKTLTINVYNLCDNAGSNCVSTGYAGHEFYAAETNAIWAQAGISVNFNYLGTINSTLFSTIDDTPGSGHTFWDLQSTYGLSDYNNNIVDMFLVQSIDGGAAYGEGWYGAAGLVMDMGLIMNYGNAVDYPYGRIDTMAHELGHNLGLDPTSDPQYAGPGDPGHSNDPNQLMASGLIRNVPGTIADIAPNGLMYDQFSTYQIDYARNSPILRDVVNPAPEPGIYALLALGLINLIVIRRRPRA